MVLDSKKDTPVSAPHIQNMSSLLVAYKNWSGNASMSVLEFYFFMIAPSAEREGFVHTLSATYVNDNGFIKLKY